MIVNKDEVLQTVRKLVNDSGYDFFCNGVANLREKHNE